MINKKGQDRTTIIIAILFVVVLAGIYLFLFGPGKALFKNFENLIPGFNATKEKAEASQIIGYVIEDAKVQYYDGQTWLEVKDRIKIGGREVAASTALSYFQSYYGQKRIISDTTIFGVYTTSGELFVNPDKILEQSYWNSIKEYWFGSDPEYKEKIYNKGGTIIIILKDSKDNNLGNFILSPDNLISFLKSGESKSSTHPLQEQIKSYYITWRDSIFKTPMSFEGSKYCTAKTKLKDKTYIVLDLSKPTTASSC